MSLRRQVSGQVQDENAAWPLRIRKEAAFLPGRTGKPLAQIQVKKSAEQVGNGLVHESQITKRTFGYNLTNQTASKASSKRDAVGLSAKRLDKGPAEPIGTGTPLAHLKSEKIVNFPKLSDGDSSFLDEFPQNTAFFKSEKAVGDGFAFGEQEIGAFLPDLVKRQGTCLAGVLPESCTARPEGLDMLEVETFPVELDGAENDFLCNTGGPDIGQDLSFSQCSVEVEEDWEIENGPSQPIEEPAIHTWLDEEQSALCSREGMLESRWPPAQPEPQWPTLLTVEVVELLAELEDDWEGVTMDRFSTTPQAVSALQGGVVDLPYFEVRL